MSRILAIVLSLVLCLGLLAVTGYAAEESTLELTLKTDKEEYVAGDQVIVTLEAKNNGETNLKNVNMTIKAPEGLNTADATKALETLAAGASAKLEATYQLPQPVNPETGDNSRIVLVAVLGLLSVAAMVGLTWNRKSAAMVLAIMMVLGMALVTVPANAAETAITETATVNVKFNGQKYTVTATVTAEVEEPAAPADVLTLDFEDGAGSGEYKNTSWAEQKYTASGWVNSDKLEMNSRSKEGVDGKTSKIANFVCDSTTRMYTYTIGRTLESVSKVSIDLGNYYAPNKNITFKLVLIDADGNSHYASGNSEFITFAANNGFDRLEYTLNNAVANVVAIRVVTQGTQGGTTQYLYVDNISVTGSFGAAPAAPQKVTLDFEDGAGSGEYKNTSWAEQKYTASGWVNSDKLEMNSRSKEGVDGKTSKIANFVCDSTTRMYTYTIGSTLESVSKVSIDLGNYYNPNKDITFKLVLIDADGNSHYVSGNSDFITFAATDGFVHLEYTLTSAAANIVAIRVVTQGTQGGTTQYLYVDNIIIE